MKFKNLIPTLILVVPLCFLAPTALAQQSSSPPASEGAQQPTAPIGNGSQSGPVPAGRGLSSPDAADALATPQSEPDTHPLTSGELYSLGSTAQAREIFDPQFFLIQSGTYGNLDAATTTPASNQFASITSVGGSLSASHLWSHYSVIASYNGVGNFYRGANVQLPNTQYQDLGVSSVMQFGRWILRTRNDFTYAPQPGFGAESFGGPGLIGQVGSTGVLGGLNSGIGTGQTIQTGEADRVSDTALGEIDFSASRRSQFTFTGSYALLHFIQTGFLNSNEARGQVGWSYLLDPKNTIGIIASYDRTMYQTGEVIQDSEFDLSLGRKITGRLAFQVSGGEGLLHFDDFAPSIPQRWVWDANAALTYSLRRNDYTLSYARATQDGSGVLLGSNTDTARASMNHHFTRFTSAGLNAGYTKSNALVPSAATLSTFSGWYGGVNLSRQVGRHFFATFNYGAQRQTEGAGVCPVASCATTAVLQTFGVNLAWHPRTITLE